MPESAPMKTGDGRFGYEAAGDPGAPPLVFLHGIGGAARAWRGQLDSFGDRFRTIAWDMPGYGGSAPLADRQHRHPRRRLAGLSAAARRDKANPGRAFDRRHDRAAMAHHRPRHRHAPSYWRRPVRHSANPTATGRNPSSRRGSVRSIAAKPWLRWRRHWSRNWSATILTTAAWRSPATAWPRVPEATYRATMLALMGFDQRDALKNIAVPTLVLSGSKDKNAPAPMMSKMATYIPSAKYVELEGVGHLVNLERPGAFNAALDQFLKAHVAATQGDGMMTVQASKSAAAIDEHRSRRADLRSRRRSA